FSEEEIALACASHSGQPVHIRIVKIMLERAGFTEGQLQCGVHPPFNEKEAGRIVRSGDGASTLHNNCSGKHAAMLAFARHIGADTVSYTAIENPIQQKILSTIAQFAEIGESDIALAIDGCVAPNFAMPISAMARAFINLMSPPASFDAATRDASRRIVSTITKFPELIGGTGRLDTMLMQAAPNSLISKVGADGVWLCGILPSDKYPAGLAIALKIEDGDDKRARPVVAVEVLKRLEIFPTDCLPELSPMPITNRRGDSVGHVEAVLDKLACGSKFSVFSR
ncbi:MAG: asparaginase, partial [Acidobacteria bacterium]|nr:asparaginase [Acidobacteriota bacterium]